MPEAIGPYQLQRKIAQGGMAEVFVATREGELGGFVQQVAIKRIFPHLVDDPEIIDMFIDEARIASRLHHPNIVQTYDLGQSGQYVYIAMEYVDGCDLRTLCEEGLRSDSFISRELAARIVSDAAAGLHYAHTALDDVGRPMHIIHRDVSPQNVLISRDGSVKVCDFGIAKAEARLTQTRAGQVKGKFAYMSPEQAIGDGRPLDARSDVFSLGIILYEITAITRLFRAKTDIEAIRMIAQQDIKPPSALRPDFPKGLEAIILKALAREPDDRYQSAEQLHLALEEWLLDQRARANSVHLARYMRELFPQDQIHADLSMELPRFGQSSADATGPMRAVIDDAPPEQQDEVTRDLDVGALRASLAQDTHHMPEAPTLGAPSGDAGDADDGGLRVAGRQLQWTPVQGRPVISRQTGQPIKPRLPFAQRPSLPEHASPEEAPVEEEAPLWDEELDGPPEISVRRAAPVDLASLKPTARPVRPKRRDPEPEPAPEPEPQVPRAEIPKGPPGARRPPRRGGEPEDAPALRPARSADASLDSMELDGIKTSSKAPVIIIALLAVVGVGGVFYYVQSTTPKTTEPDPKLNPPKVDPEAYKARLKPVVTLARTQATLKTKPEAARVFINGRLAKGLTPNDYAIVAAATNEIMFIAPERLARRVVGPADALKEAPEIPLDKKQGVALVSVNVSALQAGAKVYHNGVLVGTSPVDLRELAADQEQHIQVLAEGYLPFAGIFEFQAGDRNDVSVSLIKLEEAPAEVEVQFNVKPQGAQVLIDGQATCKSPCSHKVKRGARTDVEFKQEGFRPSKHVLEIEGEGAFEYRELLDRLDVKTGRATIEPSGVEAERVLIDGRDFGAPPVRGAKLKVGSHAVTLRDAKGKRYDATIKVEEDEHTRHELRVRDGSVRVRRSAMR